jgi:hypothetical protein
VVNTKKMKAQKGYIQSSTLRIISYCGTCKVSAVTASLAGQSLEKEKVNLSPEKGEPESV